MKIAIYSDIHSQKLYFPTEKIDVVFLLGDIYWTDVKKIDEYFSCPIIGVLGNHDVLDTFRRTNVIDVHQKEITLGDFKIAGFGGAPRYTSKENCAQYEEWEAQKFIKNLGTVDIFLAHSNPTYAINPDKRDSHRGFKAFSTLIEGKKTTIFLHGHIHENTDSVVNGTRVISTYGYRELVL